MTSFMAGVVLGCSPSPTVSLEEVEAALAPAAAVVPVEGRLVAEHDLGPILADGRELEHAFTIDNPSDRPLAVTSVRALRPCCSAVETLPEPIATGGQAELRVVLKPGHQTEARRATFRAETDDPSDPVRLFSVAWSALAPIECSVAGGGASDLNLRPGSPGRAMLRVTCRRVGSAGRSIPAVVMATDGAIASWSGPPRELGLAGEIQQVERDVSVELAAGPTPGTKVADLRFSWDDGSPPWSHRLVWKVEPFVRVFPAGLVLSARDDAASRRVTLTSDRAFRVTRIEGAEARGTLPAAANTLHTIDVVFGEAETSGPTRRLVTIHTDHPEQATVVLTALIAGRDSP